MQKKSANQVTKELAVLIKNLNSTEKAYYKKMAKRHADVNTSKHLRLFDILDKTEEIGNKSLIDELGIQNMSQLSSLKSYLLHDILDALSFLKRNEPEANVYNSLLDIDILLQKRLFGHVRKMIDKMKASSLQKQYFVSYRQLLKQEYTLTSLTQPKNYQDKLRDLNNEIGEVTKLIFYSEELQIAFREMVILKDKASVRVTETENIEVEHCLSRLKEIAQPKNLPPSFSFYFHCVNAMGYYLLHNNQSLLIHYDKLNQLWAEYPHLATSHFVLFIESATVILNADFLNRNITRAEKKLANFDKLAEKYLILENDKKAWSILAFNTKLKIYHKRGDYEKVAILLRSSKDILAQASIILAPSQRMTIISSIAISLFVLEKFKEADELIFEVKELNRNAKRDDVFYFTLIFHLAIIFEMKEWYRLHNMVEAAYQILYNRTKLRPFEKDILLFLRKLTTNRAKNKLKEETALFLNKMEKYKNDPTSKLYMLYFNYYGWIESKLQGINYTDYVKQSLMKNPVK